MSELSLPGDYGRTLEELKAAIRAAQLRARVAVNSELIRVYWQIGRTILDQQAREGWGAKVIDRLGQDLRSAFPDMRGLSRSNLDYMRRLAVDFPDPTFVPQAVEQMPWGQVRTLYDKLDTAEERAWYAHQAVEHGWSRAVLAYQIGSGLRARLGAGTTNFPATLPAEDSDAAREMFRDPYHLDFLRLGPEARERDVEAALVAKIRQTLAEFGPSFAFVGQQHHFEIDGDDFYIDLLFFNVEQLRYVVIELKTEKFKAEHLGQLNLYVQWVDQHLRTDRHAETIGLLLVAGRNDAVAQLALNGMSAPTAISDWKALPTDEPTPPEVQAIVNAAARPLEEPPTDST